MAPNPKPKAKSQHFSRKQMLIAAGVLTALVIAYVYYRKKKAATAPAAAYSSGDTTGGLPGQNYLPATGLGGASQLGDGVAAPPPVSCPGGQTPNPDGTCPPPITTPPPPPPPPPTTGSYRHSCVSGAGPGCGGPNMHCEYRWVAGDTGGQPAPPTDCIPQAGQPSGPPNQSSTVAPGAAQITPTADVLSGIGTSSPSLPPASPSLELPTATADASVRLLHVTQYAGRGNPSNPWASIAPNPPPTFPTAAGPSSAGPGVVLGGGGPSNEPPVVEPGHYH